MESARRWEDDLPPLRLGLNLDLERPSSRRFEPSSSPQLFEINNLLSLHRSPPTPSSSLRALERRSPSSRLPASKASRSRRRPRIFIDADLPSFLPLEPFSDSNATVQEFTTYKFSANETYMPSPTNWRFVFPLSRSLLSPRTTLTSPFLSSCAAL